MRITLQLQKEGIIELPIHYNHIVQSFIYRHMEEGLREFLHDEGYKYGERSYKCFTFSRLLGKAMVKGQRIIFIPPIELVISSPKLEVLEGFARVIINKDELFIGENKLYLGYISAQETPLLAGRVRIKMLSPITIYSTLKDAEGRKKTYYYNPWERDFSVLLKENLWRKYFAIYGVSIEGKEFQVVPLRVRREDEKIIIYKGTVIKGWMGVYEIEGDEEMLKLAYEAGLGSKNSQGFGCFDIIEGGI